MSASVEPIDLTIALRGLNEQLRQCENGEGMVCSNIEGNIKCHVEVCETMLHCTRDWANRVFTGQIPFNSDTEALLKQGIQHLIKRARSVAVHGIEMKGFCCELAGLNPLCQYIVYFEFQLENWVSPKRAVGPAARVIVPDASAQEIMKRLEELSSK